MKKLLLASLMFASTPLLAHDINTDACDVDLNAGVKINAAEISFTHKGQDLYQIVGRDTLIVDGETISLNSRQEQLVEEYASSIRDVVPQVKAIALDALELANDGVTLAFNELLGEGNDIGAELSNELSNIGEAIDMKLSVENGIEFSENGVTGEDLFGEDFEQRFEDSIERAVENSMGSLLIAVGQQLLMSGGDMEAFEARMETFGEQIEYQMETRARAIEDSADELCNAMMEIDALETALQDEVSALSETDVLNVKLSNHDKA